MKLDFKPGQAPEQQMDVLIAMGLYKTESEAIKDSLRGLLRQYKGYLMPNAQVKEVLAEIPQEVELSEELAAQRRRETDRYLEG